MKSSERKQVLVFSMLIILLAQINLHIFASNFRVSMGVLLLPVLVFLHRRIPVLPIAVLAGLGVCLSRALIHSVMRSFELSAFADFYPELVFYVFYGLMFHFHCHRHDYRIPHRRCYAALFLMDYLANLLEMICRLQLKAFTFPLQADILLVAAVRTLILWTIISGLSQYKFLLFSTAHANRYQRLILLISKLNSEIIWMRKNSAMIEDAMAKSYRLYGQLQEQQAVPELTQSALNVAKDIHEVKKEYVMILRGISEALELNLRDEVMSLSDIMKVLENAMNLLADQQGKQLEFHIDIQNNFKTDKHYFLLSVLRNLLTNAVEASRKDTISLGFIQTEAEGQYLFSVCDDGPGIPTEYLEQIFLPGFSTKINFDTGEINRGLGLNLVEDVIMNQLQGSISVQSRPGSTVFSIIIPREQLEVQQ